MSERLALVIEDDFDASVIFAKALEVIGFTTEVISSGDKALERLKEASPEMIVLDLHLPEVMGTDILRFIRSQDRLAQTRVIIASADPRSAETVQEYADLVLIKPTTFSQVRDFATRLAASPAKRRKTAEAKSAAQSEKTAEKTAEKPTENTSGAKQAEKVESVVPAESAQSTESTKSSESAAPAKAAAPANTVDEESEPPKE